MHRKHSSTNLVLWVEIAGFLAIVALSWLNELADLAHHIFGTFGTGNPYEAVLETTVTILVAMPVIYLTRRLLVRMYYVEHFFYVCAWCKKIKTDGQWVHLDEFFKSDLDAQTSHSICPHCSAEYFKSRQSKATIVADPDQNA